jgi:hypothetical protein
MATLVEPDTRPTCPCCNGSGMHGHRPYPNASPGDDWEGSTNCEERGTTWFDDARPNSCTGYRMLARRNR